MTNMIYFCILSLLVIVGWAIIDDESGIILNFKGYDENENLTNYISTKQISFSCRGIKKLDINNYKEYNLNNQIDTGNSYEDNP